MAFERVVLSNLVYNEDYARKVVPFLKTEYFEDFPERVVYELIEEYVNKYSNFPSKEALAIELTHKEGLDEAVFKESRDIISEMERDPDTQLDWLVDKTEKYCQDKALYLAIQKAVRIYGEKEQEQQKISRGAIPQILTDALAVSFDTHIGHDFIDDAIQRYNFYTQTEVRIPFDLEFFNKITKGGLPKKTLNIILAGTGVGKSLFMCHMAASNLTAGLNVLYITLEMSEYRIAERIDANLLNIPLAELSIIPQSMYESKITKLKGNVKGKLIIKEYPTSCAGSANFRHLLNELKIKKNFIPDIIYIDYLNICMSSRMKYNGNVNSYTYIKAIAEELRGLAVEQNVPIVSATQTTRSGYSNSDVDLTDTSESFGLPATADFMFAAITSEELAQLNQILVKQLKNRYSDIGTNTRFVVGIDRSKMRLYDLDDSAQDGITGAGDKPVFDKTKFAEDDEVEIRRGTKKFDKSKFDGFK